MIASRSHYEEERNELRRQKRIKRKLAKGRAPLAIFQDIKRMERKRMIRQGRELRRMKGETHVMGKLAKKLGIRF